MMKKRIFAYIALALSLALCVSAYQLQTPAACTPTPPVQSRPAQQALEAPSSTAAQPEPTVVPTTKPEPTVAPQPETITARIATVGDLMCHLKNLKAGYDRQTGTFDFARFFDLVEPYITIADYAVGNLETTLAEGDSLEDFSGFPLFKTPDEFAEALANAGFDLLTTANNHMLDNGFTGLSRTLDVLDELGVDHTGSARTKEEAQTPLIVNINDIQFGFLAYTYKINISRTPANMKAYCLNLYNLSKVKADIAAAREAGAEVVLVSLHWGPQENNTKPSVAFKNAVKELLESGADGILGHHPHVLQPMEWITVTRDSGETVTCPVLYSQGNFHCNSAHEGNAESAITYLTFEKDASTGKVSCTKMVALPVYIYRIRTEPRDFILVPIGLALDDEEYYKEIGLDIRKTLERGWEHITTSLGDQVSIARR